MTSLGVDAVEVSRIERLLRLHPTLKPKLFSRDEIAYCERARRAGPHFAARFCAKEATFKALGGEWLAGDVAWHEVEVVRAPHGRPSLHLSGATLERFRLLGYTASDVTLSHTHDLAFAVVAVAGDAAPGGRS